jgi:hypothetical protein
MSSSVLEFSIRGVECMLGDEGQLTKPSNNFLNFFCSMTSGSGTLIALVFQVSRVSARSSLKVSRSGC